jgi:hypothetical protein
MPTSRTQIHQGLMCLIESKPARHANRKLAHYRSGGKDAGGASLQRGLQPDSDRLGRRGVPSPDCRIAPVSAPAQIVPDRCNPGCSRCRDH